MLDFKYLDEVVKLARNADSNALAEIYAATAAKQYAFALGYLKDEFLAQDALHECYINAFNGIYTIDSGLMAVAYITMMNINACNAILAAGSGAAPEAASVAIGENEYTLRRIQRLRISVSCCLLLRYMCHMEIKQIASLLEIRAAAVRRYIRAGREELNEQV